MLELPQPDRDRVSTLTALVLLTYTLIRIVVLPTLDAEFAILGLIIRFEFNTNFVMLTLAALLATAGADWLIRSHPNFENGKSISEHWIIPGLAALGSGAILTRIPGGPPLWIGLILTAVLLIAVLMAEYVVVDARDPRFDTASVGLSALAYLLLIGAFFAILTADLRAAFSIPLIFIASAAVAWRLHNLNPRDRAAPQYALLMSAITTQLAWGLHYWPLPPLRGALLLGLLVYLASGLTLMHQQGRLERSRVWEFAAVFTVAIVLIFSLT
ncbi:MAG: hypothetical protein GTO14_08685 [Anaerolineales bacterium]|nr:hypothetical protein [Anaerolineales bacterium]